MPEELPGWSVRRERRKHITPKRVKIEDRLALADFVVVEEERPDIICPYCLEEIDILSFTYHVEDKHASRSRTMLCAICNLIVGDILTHIPQQHERLFELRRSSESQKTVVPNQGLSPLKKELLEARLQLLSAAGASKAIASEGTTARACSSPVLRSPASEAKAFSDAVMSGNEELPAESVTSDTWKTSFNSSASVEEREKERKETARRAAFVQALVVSTLLSE